MREIRLYGSERGGAARSPYPYQVLRLNWIPAFAGMTHSRLDRRLNFAGRKSESNGDRDPPTEGDSRPSVTRAEASLRLAVQRL